MRRFAVLGVALGLVLLAGCSSGIPALRSSPIRSIRPAPTAVAPKPAKPAAPKFRPVWTKRGVKSLSGLSAVPGGFVTYGVVQNRLQVLKLRARDGSVSWQWPATPSYITPGVEFSTPVWGNTAVYLSPSDSVAKGWASVVGLNTDNGSVRWSFGDGELIVYNQPYLCAGDKDICLLADDGGAGTWESIVLAKNTGRVVSRHVVSDNRRLGDGLYDGWGTLVHRSIDGAVIWQRPYRQPFGGRDVTPDAGWDIVRGHGLYVGFLGDRTFLRKTVDLGKATIAAFHDSTGAPVWQQRGMPGCNGLLPFEWDTAIVCRDTGIATYHKRQDTTDYQHLDVTVARIDPVTGRTMWSWHAGNAPKLVFSDDSGAEELSATKYILTTSTGKYLLDTRHGVSRLNGVRKGWCQVDSSTNVRDAPRSGYVVAAYRVCDSAGHTGGLPASAPEDIVTRSGGVIAWTSNDGIHAIRKT